MRPKQFELGTVFGSLTLIRLLPSVNGRRFAEYQCVCGVKKAINFQNVYRGLSTSCGCQKPVINGDIHRTHGLSRTTEYRIWSLMIQRCENQKNPAYDRYGGRGIKVCVAWHRFETFLADMGERPKGKSIDRINNDSDYEPTNCRWATAFEQVHNRRQRKLRRTPPPAMKL
jgi:hypothetical protein